MSNTHKTEFEMSIETISNDYFVGEAGKGLPQAWMFFDPESGAVWFDCNRASNNSMTSDVWNNLVIRWSLPYCLQGDALTRRIESLAPLFERIASGWERDGTRGTLSDEAQEAIDDIDDALLDVDGFLVYDADELVADYDGSATTARDIALEIYMYLDTDQRALGGIPTLEAAAAEKIEAGND